MANPRLLLVDGSFYLYRAFHGLPPLTNAQGEPTGALFGVLKMLRRLQNDWPSDHLAVIFDARGKNFRHALYPNYKANRPPMPPDLAAQIEPLHQIIRAWGWPLLCISGVEADDVIGTLAKKAAAKGMSVLMSTGDKDLTQLVDANIVWYNSMSGERLDVAGVIKKYGVPPAAIPDFLALMGDTSDNIPGVEKCGEKTACRWLQSYENMENIITHAAEIKGVVGEKLRAHLDFLPLGKKLTTIDCALQDLPEPETLQLSASNKEGIDLFYRRYGLHSLQAETPSRPANTVPSETPPPPPLETTFIPKNLAAECILDWDSFSRWEAKISTASLTALDTETTGLSAMTARIVGISLSVSENDACYIPLAHRAPGVLDQLPIDAVLSRLKPWLEDAHCAKVLQNASFDQHVFANHGVALRGIAEDTLLQSYVLDAGKYVGGAHDLGSLATRHLQRDTISYGSLCGTGVKAIGFDQVGLEAATAYAAEDAAITLLISKKLTPLLKKEERLDQLYRHIELPVREVIWQMERHGVRIDSDLLQKQSQRMGEKILHLESEAFVLAGQPFNLASPKQLSEILFEKLGLPSKKKTGGGGLSTNEAVLSELALDYPLPKVLLEHRSLAKLKGTYTDKLPRMVNPKTGRIHTHFSQGSVVTGRLSSSDPNLQNIPIRSEEGKRIREAFVAAPGHQLISADYSQIELRIMAHLSGDERLLSAFAAGEDVHRATAAEVFGVALEAVDNQQRRIAKSINFGLIYGMSAFGLAKQIGIERSAAQNYIARYFARYPGVANYMEITRESAHQKGYVETLFGRRLYLPDIHAPNALTRQAAERAAINAPMQGTAADIIKKAMITVYRQLQDRHYQSRLILQVHDELILEVPENEVAEIENALPGWMQNVGLLTVPLIVEVGTANNWGAAHA